MDMLHMILPKNVIDKVIPDANAVIRKYTIRTKQDLNKQMASEYDYWIREVTMNNPIQEAIVLDSLWRVLHNMSSYSGPY